MLIVNYKTYLEATGPQSVSLSEIIKEASEETGTKVIACPQVVDLREVSSILSNETWVQHVDHFERGRATGYLPVEVAKESGASGVLLNHSEHKLSLGDLSASLAMSKKTGLTTLVFAEDVKEAELVAKLSPDWIGYEPPELVASKNSSVSKSKPEVIDDVVKAVDPIPVVVGAGVKDRQDVVVALERGAKGVAVASAVVLAQDPKEVLLELLGGFK